MNSTLHAKACATGLALAAVLVSCREAPLERAPAKVDAAPVALAEMVTVMEFGADGRALGLESMAKIVLPDEEWRRRMTPLGYAVTRHRETELAFTGKYDKHHASGSYRCAACNLALFSSETKFDSGTGWPSFWAPIAAENVYNAGDGGRDEVLCKRCDAHLGHVFADSPEPTGLRYCMNSAALAFSGN